MTSRSRELRHLNLPVATPQSPSRDSAISESRLRDLAACFRARFYLFFHALLARRAQGKPGARCTRGLACKKVERRTRAYRFSGSSPAFPAQWFYGLCRALPGDRLSCHRRLRRSFPANLTPASRRQDHTILPSASCALRQRRRPRPPHPRPRIRDDRERPSDWSGMSRLYSCFYPRVKRNFCFSEIARWTHFWLFCPPG